MLNWIEYKIPNRDFTIGFFESEHSTKTIFRFEKFERTYIYTSSTYELEIKKQDVPYCFDLANIPVIDPIDGEVLRLDRKFIFKVPKQFNKHIKAISLSKQGVQLILAENKFVITIRKDKVVSLHSEYKIISPVKTQPLETYDMSKIANVLSILCDDLKDKGLLKCG